MLWNLTRLISRRVAKHARRRSAHRAPFSAPVEVLEHRTLLTAMLDGGVLSIVGSERADDIRLEAGRKVGDVALFGVPDVPDGTVFRGVGAVEIDTLGGDNAIQVEPLQLMSNALISSAFLAINAGAGNDTIAVRRSRGFGFIEMEHGDAERCELRIDGGEGNNSATVYSDPEFSRKHETSQGGLADCYLTARFGAGHDSLIFEPNSQSRDWPAQLDFDIDMGGGDDVLDVRLPSSGPPAQGMHQVTAFIDDATVTMGAGNDVASIVLGGAEVAGFRLSAGDGDDDVSFSGFEVFSDERNHLGAVLGDTRAVRIDLLDLGAGNDSATVDLKGYEHVDIREIDAGDGTDTINVVIEDVRNFLFGSPSAGSAVGHFKLLDGDNTLLIEQYGESDFEFTVELGRGVNTVDARFNPTQNGFSRHTSQSDDGRTFRPYTYDSYRVVSDRAGGSLKLANPGDLTSVSLSNFAIEGRLEADFFFATPPPPASVGRELERNFTVEVNDMAAGPASELDLRVRGGTAADTDKGGVDGADFLIWQRHVVEGEAVGSAQIGVTAAGGGDDMIDFRGDFQTARGSSDEIVLDGGSGDDIIRASLSMTNQGSLLFEVFAGSGNDTVSVSATLGWLLTHEDAADSPEAVIRVSGGDGDDHLELLPEVDPDLLDLLFTDFAIDGGDGFDTCLANRLVEILNCEEHV